MSIKNKVTGELPNITSYDPDTGVISGISVTGNLSAGNIVTVGNVTGNYILGNGSQLTGLPVQPGTYGNSNVATFLGDFGSNAISTSGNITGNYILGDGSQLTNLPTGNYSNSNVPPS